jgi:hypothetical protein
MILAGLLLIVIARSYFVGDSFHHGYPAHSWDDDMVIRISRGGIEVFRTPALEPTAFDFGGDPPSRASWQYGSVEPIPLFTPFVAGPHYSHDIAFAGFFYRSRPDWTSNGPLSVTTPGVVDAAISLYYLFALFALYPIVHVLATWRRRRRVGRNLCTRCGYNLRASAERCPECGKIIPPRNLAAPVSP